MMKLNISEAKTHLSRYLERVEDGETILLCRRNNPVAEIRPLARKTGGRRPVGTAPAFELPPEFFDPLPDDLLHAFEGGAGDKDKSTP